MTTKIAARVLLALGFLAASVSYSSWIVSRTVLDPSATRRATRALITAPPVRATLARELHDALAPRLGKAATDRKLDAAITAAVADPRFARAFDDAVVHLQAAILSDKSGRITLDAHQVAAALRAAIARHDPALSKRVRSLGGATVSIGSTQIPHIGGVTHEVGRIGALAATAAILLITGALVLVRDQSMIGRVGRRVAYLAVGPILAFVVLPRLLDANHGGGYVVAASILHGYGRRVIFSAVALVVVGVSTWLITLVLPVLSRRRPTAAPRSAAVRPAPPTPPASAVPEKLYL